MKDAVLNFYGFKRLPFGKDVASADLFTTRSQQDALAMLLLGAAEEDILLMTGPVGSGKSVVLRSFIADVDGNVFKPVYLRGGPIGLAELYKTVLLELKIDPPRYMVKVKTLFFSAVADMRKKPVILIDDAQDLSHDALLGVKAMVNFKEDSQNRVTFILSGQPELRTILAYSQFLPLRQRIKLGVHLAAMDLKETCGYIDHALALVGRTSPLFSGFAKTRIFKRTGGVPRAINALCYQAIVNGAIERRDVIDTLDIPEPMF